MPYEILWNAKKYSVYTTPYPSQSGVVYWNDDIIEVNVLCSRRGEALSLKREDVVFIYSSVQTLSLNLRIAQ